MEKSPTPMDTADLAASPATPLQQLKHGGLVGLICCESNRVKPVKPPNSSLSTENKTSPAEGFCKRGCFLLRAVSKVGITAHTYF